MNSSNSFYKKEVNEIVDEKLRKKVVFLDFSLALPNTIQILNQEKNEDVVFMQSTHSIHNKHNPYISYIIKNSKLYRLESFKALEYPLSAVSEFVEDEMGEVKGFRVYTSDKTDVNATGELYLVHIDYKENEDTLYKIKVLNRY